LSGIGSIPVDRLLNSIDELMRAGVPGRFEIATRTAPLSEVEDVWSTPGNIPRIVFNVA
jgi:hypothetical protein